jgi:hypothetical protein
MKRSERKKVKTDTNQGRTDPHENERDNHERHIEGSVHVRGEVETKFPPSLIEKYDAGREKDSAHNFKQFIVGMVTLIVVAIYALLTAFQVWFTRQANRDARDSFVKDHAPYVWVKKPDPPIMVANQKLEWSFSYSNYGRSPALNLHSCMALAYGRAGRAIVPQIKELSPADCTSRNPSETVLPPGGDKFSTVQSENVFPQPEIDVIKDTDAGIILQAYFAFFVSALRRLWIATETTLSNGLSDARPFAEELDT